jgi:hypothetical protein
MILRPKRNFDRKRLALSRGETVFKLFRSLALGLRVSNVMIGGVNF